MHESPHLIEILAIGATLNECQCPHVPIDSIIYVMTLGSMFAANRRDTSSHWYTSKIGLGPNPKT